MGERSQNVVDCDMGEVLSELNNIIQARHMQANEDSYTSRLLCGPPEKLYKKVVEEALELVLAAKDDDHDHIRYEAADLLYHMLVLLKRTNISLEELAGELKVRMK